MRILHHDLHGSFSENEDEPRNTRINHAPYEPVPIREISGISDPTSRTAVFFDHAEAQRR